MAAGTTDTDGSFRFEDVPMPTTAGYYVRAFACDGDDTQWFPTATVLLQDAMAGLGPNDELGGVSAWIATSDDVAAVAGAILEHSNVDSIVEVGVRWRNDDRSTVDPLRDSARMFGDVVRLRLLHRRGAA